MIKSKIKRNKYVIKLDKNEIKNCDDKKYDILKCKIICQIMHVSTCKYVRTCTTSFNTSTCAAFSSKVMRDMLTGELGSRPDVSQTLDLCRIVRRSAVGVREQGKGKREIVRVCVWGGSE